MRRRREAAHAAREAQVHRPAANAAERFFKEEFGSTRAAHLLDKVSAKVGKARRKRSKQQKD